MTQRLPIPGSDSGDWGDILNSFLEVSLASDGTLNSGVVSTAQITNNAVTNAQLDTNTQTTLAAVPGAAQKANNLSDLSSASTARTNLGLGTAATISSTAGGDLTGTLPNPTVAKVNGVTVTGTPNSNQVLTATSSTAATWTTPSGGSGNGGSSTLAGDTDVALNSPANGQVLTYNTSSSKWVNQTPGANSNATAIDSVTVTGTPSSGQVLTATSSSAADWQAVGAGSPLTMSGVISGTTSASTFTNGASAPVDVSNGGGETYFSAGNSGSAVTLSAANGNVQSLILTGNATISLTSPANNSFRSLLLLLQQDSTGSRTVTWPGSVNWGGPGAPVLTTTASKTDIINLFTVNGGTTWYGAVGIQGY
jgi:hypothetical protein